MIDTSHWEAVAFFRETELPNLAVGDSVDVFVMANSRLAVPGTISAIGWGVRSTDGATILGLPIIANSLNWVKVAKRFPVYVELHEPPVDLMRVGASAVVVVRGETEAGHGGDQH